MRGCGVGPVAEESRGGRGVGGRIEIGGGATEGRRWRGWGRRDEGEKQKKRQGKGDQGTRGAAVAASGME
jgi:hypothetical protein